MSKEKNKEIVFVQIMSGEKDWEAVPAIWYEFESREMAAFWARTTANLMDKAIRLSYPPEGLATTVRATNLNGSYFTPAFDYKKKEVVS